jgi:uncharacterized membrane protein YtjA (UPF0391 family)
MRSWALAFSIIASVAAVIALGGSATNIVTAAKVIFTIALVGTVMTFIMYASRQ